MVDLRSSNLKLERAIKHFDDFNSEIVAFRDRNPHSIVVDEDSEPSVKIYKIMIRESIPECWSGYIGDIVHNLMCSLDSLATALVQRSGIDAEEILKKTYFPIEWSAKRLLEGRSASFLENCGPKPGKYIRRLQPYRNGLSNILVHARQLDNIDKHRRIIPARAGLLRVEVRSKDGARVVYSGKKTDLRDGDELLRVAFFEPHFDDQTHFTFEVTFGENTGISEGLPILDTLSAAIHYVQRIVFFCERSYF